MQDKMEILDNKLIIIIKEIEELKLRKKECKEKIAELRKMLEGV